MEDKRGCVFFNFGNAGYIIKLFVAIFSLRQVYQGPVTLLLEDILEHKRLALEMARFNVNIKWFKSSDIHRINAKPYLLTLSPYETTFIFDGDLLFLKSFDDLWQPLEEKGFLLTRFHANPYGVNGTATDHRWAYRLGHLDDIRTLLSEEEFSAARKKLLEDRIDINIGVMGYSKGRGDAFMRDFFVRIEKAKKRKMTMSCLDEMIILALSNKYPHHLAEEKWNCPADVFFRKTSLKEAVIVHYFADGAQVEGRKMGRQPNTEAGPLWFSKFNELSEKVDLSYWKKYDEVVKSRT